MPQGEATTTTDPTPLAAAAPREGGSAALLRDLRTVPNLVSLGRIAFIYLSIWLFHEHRFGLGLLLGVLAGLSDYLDGYLARRMNQSTRIGGLLDQAADILFISGCILMFVMDGTWPSILLYIVLFRETLVMNLRASAAEMGFGLPSIFLGKWASNWMFYSLAIMGAARGRLFPDPLNLYAAWLSHFAMVVGVTSSLLTAGIYLRTYARRYQPKGASGDGALPGAGAAAAHVAQGRGDEGARGGARDDR